MVNPNGYLDVVFMTLKAGVNPHIELALKKVKIVWIQVTMGTYSVLILSW